MVFLCAEGNFSGGEGGPGGSGGGPGGAGGQNGQKRAKKGVFGGVRGGGPKWAVSVPEWYTSGSASTASHSTGWQKSPEYALIRIAAGPPFPGHFPPPGPGQKSPVSGGPFWPTPTKARPSSSFLPQKSRRGLPASHLRRDHHNPWWHRRVLVHRATHLRRVTLLHAHRRGDPRQGHEHSAHRAHPAHTPHTHAAHTSPPPRTTFCSCRRGWWEVRSVHQTLLNYFISLLFSLSFLCFIFSCDFFATRVTLR